MSEEVPNRDHSVQIKNKNSVVVLTLNSAIHMKKNVLLIKLILHVHVLCYMVATV